MPDLEAPEQREEQGQGKWYERMRYQILLFIGGIALFVLVGGWILDWYIAPHTSAQKKDLVQALGLITAGVAGAVGIFFTWRGQRQAREAQEQNRIATQAQLENAQEELGLTRQGQITERFTRAIDQLGNESLEIRLGGIHALERIARESEEDHWPIMEILIAYVRQNSRLSPDVGQERTEDVTDEQRAMEGSGGKSETTEPSAPDPDIQAVMTILRRRSRSYGQGELEPLDLSDMNLSRADLSGAVLSGAVLSGTNLSEAYLSGVVLAGAHFPEAVLAGAHLLGADLSRAYLLGADLSGAGLASANLSGAVLSSAVLAGADLLRANLSSADLGRADLSGARLPEADLSGADLREADLSGANLTAADFSGASLLGADLSGARLHGTDLSEADLSGANLSGASLRGAAFVRTQEGVSQRLYPVDVQNLTQEQLERSHGDATTILPPRFKPPAHWGMKTDEQTEGD